jgi:hypothetical protein
MTPWPEFRVSSARVHEVTSDIVPYAIAVGDYAVVHEQSNGQTRFLTYKDGRSSPAARGAMLARVHSVYPSARIWQRPSDQPAHDG